MQSKNSQIVKISNTGWYVETQTGLDGPFDSVNEATVFLDLIKSSNAARMEFAGLQYTPLEY
jgi:uncharacterized protein YkvS